jgi:hypothetical protein
MKACILVVSLKELLKTQSGQAEYRKTEAGTGI